MRTALSILLLFGLAGCWMTQDLGGAIAHNDDAGGTDRRADGLPCGTRTSGTTCEDGGETASEAGDDGSDGPDDAPAADTESGADSKGDAPSGEDAGIVDRLESADAGFEAAVDGSFDFDGGFDFDAGLPLCGATCTVGQICRKGDAPCSSTCYCTPPGVLMCMMPPPGCPDASSGG